MPETDHDPLLTARAALLHDLTATGIAQAHYVDVVEDALAARARWVDAWPDGGAYVVGLVAQDVQDHLIDTEGRWPPCPSHPDEALIVEPELGADPHWVCSRCGTVAAVGHL
jgi:hypothetical protein